MKGGMAELLRGMIVVGIFWGTVCCALQGGTARVNISPLEVRGVPMSGYTDGYENRSVGLHDSLYARVLVLDDGETAVAIVSLDLIGLNVDFTPEAGRLSRLLRAEGMDGWMIASTHTHGGPKILHLGEPFHADRSWPEGNPYVTWVEDRIAAGVREAREKLGPVRLSVGQGNVDLSFNRRLVKENGAVEMIWGKGRQVDSEQLGPTDPEVGVVRLDHPDGSPAAVLFNYACHPVVLGGGNRLLTADFPGFAMGLVEENFPGAMALFLQGAAGDLDPYIDVQNDFDPAREQGEELGREVVQVARKLAEEGFHLEPEPAIEWIPLAKSFRHFYDGGRNVTAHFGLLRLGRALSFVGLPGEPFVGLQLDLKSRSPAPFTFMLGYVNGYAGYFPTQQANREGGYGASYGGTMHLEAGAGEAMVAAALEELARDVWVSQLPDTLVGGAVVELEASLRPILANEEEADLYADLSQLGGPGRLQLHEIGEGVYGLNAEVGPELHPGLAEIGVFVEAGGVLDPYLTERVIVLPGGDLSIWESGQGWQVEGNGGAEFLGEEKIGEREAAAFLLNPDNTGGLGAFWTVDFLPNLSVSWVGFRSFRFLFHPGTTAGMESPWMSVFVGDQQIDLRERVDFSRAEWQAVEIPLADLGLEKEIDRIRFWGWMGGRFYLSDMVLAAERSAITAVLGEEEGGLPQRFGLEQNYPNPFNGETRIPFFLGERGEIELAVFDLVGQRVATLAAGVRESGWHEAMWEGRGLGSGVYLYRLRMGDRVEMRKLLLLK